MATRKISASQIETHGFVVTQNGIVFFLKQFIFALQFHYNLTYTEI